MPKNFDELMGEQARNPFETSGLTPEAVKALHESGDPELLQTAVNGVMRALSRGMHPDATGKQAGDFFMQLVESNKLIQGYDTGAVQQLATDYTRKKRGTKAAKPEVVQVHQDRSHELLLNIAGQPLGELGPSFNPNTGIEFTSLQKEFINIPNRLLMHRTDEDRWQLSEYHYAEIEERELDENGKLQRDNSLGHEMVGNMDWQRLVTARHVKNLQRGFMYINRETNQKLAIDAVHVSGMVHRLGDSLVLFDESGNKVDTYPNDLTETDDATDDSFYRLSLTVAGTNEDDLTVQTATARRYMYRDDEPEIYDFRLLGTTDEVFAQQVVADLRRSVRGDEPRRFNEQVTISELNVGISRSNQLSSLGFSLQSEQIKKIGEHFTPAIVPENHLVVSDGEKLYLLGVAQRLYKNMFANHPLSVPLSGY